jgi:hypothetical protein
LKGLKSKAKLKDFKNNVCAEPWEYYGLARSEEPILALRAKFGVAS